MTNKRAGNDNDKRNDNGKATTTADSSAALRNDNQEGAAE
jgi:hypothetical protein